MKKVNLYTDGACSGNPGPGGWAAILEYKGNEKEISGYFEDTTNNRMELMAVIQGLTALKEGCDVSIYTDSAYVLNAFTRGWIIAWERNGWKNSKKQTVENLDLWQMLINLTKEHKVSWIKVKGHSGHDYNERCDALARKEIADNVLG
ncbi:MAG: ribonuclease HI [Clostridia bacterium]|nr:ribonuclease HI [Clostridia bacterium]